MKVNLTVNMAKRKLSQGVQCVSFGCNSTEYSITNCKLFDNLHNNNILLLPLEKSLIVQILLYGSDNYNPSMNKIIISTVIDFIIQSKGFDDPLIK